MSSRIRLLIALVGLLSMGEVVVLALYVREVGRSAEALMRLEYAQGAAAIAVARASRCSGP